MTPVDNSVIETKVKTANESRHTDLLESRIAPLDLQPGLELRDAERYQLDELLCYHDRKFVTHLYTALRKRAPTTAELATALDDLRSGRRTKIEIIESLSTAPPEGPRPIQVTDLSSPILRRVSRWPFVGYLLRIFGGLSRLPILIQDQQRFEAYALGQQQNIADYLNEVLVPAVKRNEENSPVIADLSVTVADALESVLMLSESLIELSARHAEFRADLERLQTEQSQQTHIQTELRLELEHLQADLLQQTETTTRLEADTRALSDIQAEQRQAIEEAQRAQAATAATQQEFLIQEQRVIVETQKVVLGELQRQLEQLLAEQRQKNSELATQMRSLQSLIGATAPRATGRRAGKRVAPKSQQA